MSHLNMASLDVGYLFMNVLMNKNIDICIEILYDNNESLPKITNDD